MVNWNKLVRDVSIEIDMAEMALGCDLMEKGWKVPAPIFKVWALAELIVGNIVHQIVKIPCRIWGHAWMEESHCTPDSGSIDMDCARCGEGFHVSLY
jgi:hypothetical protein